MEVSAHISAKKRTLRDFPQFNSSSPSIFKTQAARNYDKQVILKILDFELQTFPDLDIFHIEPQLMVLPVRDGGLFEKNFFHKFLLLIYLSVL